MKGPVITVELYLWSLQIIISLTDGVFFIFETLLACLRMEPTSLDISCQSGAIDRLAFFGLFCLVKHCHKDALFLEVHLFILFCQRGQRQLKVLSGLG